MLKTDQPNEARMLIWDVFDSAPPSVQRYVESQLLELNGLMPDFEDWQVYEDLGRELGSQGYLDVDFDEITSPPPVSSGRYTDHFRTHA